MFRAKFTLKEIISITGGEFFGGNIDNEIFSISTDTRTITSEDAYLALSGENFDGHNFVPQAFENGAKLAIISKKNLIENDNNKGKFILVDNTLLAYLQIANFHRNRCSAKIVAVTGSSGKTTTKEFLYSVLNSENKTQKSIKNHNNEIGLCQTLLSIEPDTKYCVVEMGMRALGEIDLLAKYAQPEIAVITNVGTAHIGILGSQKNIAKAKCEITNYFKSNNILFAHNEELIKSTLNAEFKTIFYDIDEIKILNKFADKCEFEYMSYIFELNDGAEYNILNALVAIKIAQFEKYQNESIQRGLAEFKNIENRNEITKLDNGTVIVSDCYNANPDSTKALIKHLKEYKNKNIIFVFGDMLELGEFEEQYHKEIGQIIDNSNVNYFISIGKLAKITAESINKINKKSFDTTDDAAIYLKSIMNENSIVFLKASRGMKLEKIVEIIRGK